VKDAGCIRLVVVRCSHSDRPLAVIKVDKWRDVPRRRLRELGTLPEKVRERRTFREEHLAAVYVQRGAGELDRLRADIEQRDGTASEVAQPVDGGVVYLFEYRCNQSRNPASFEV
jgi:hypothetical protein